MSYPRDGHAAGTRCRRLKTAARSSYPPGFIGGIHGQSNSEEWMSSDWVPEEFRKKLRWIPDLPYHLPLARLLVEALVPLLSSNFR